MSQFVSGGGVDCGPSTALKDVGSLVERDYGVQRDRYVSSPQPGSSAGPSAFRARPGPAPQAQQPSPFDLAQLRSHLPQQTPGPAIAAAPVRWAEGFTPPATASKGKGRADSGAWGGEFETQRASPLAQHASPQGSRTATPALAPWQRGGYAPAEPMYGAQPMFQPSMQQQYQQPFHQPPAYMPPPPPQVLAPMPPPQRAVPQPPAEAMMQPEAQTAAQREQDAVHPDDELARTAQALVEQLDKESLASNSKLADSQFVRLLRGLGDGSVVVQEGAGTVVEGSEATDGARFVQASSGGDWANDFVVSEGSSKTAEAALSMRDGETRRKSVHFEPMGAGVPNTLEEAMAHTTSVPGVGASWEEQLTDEDFDQDAFMHYNGVSQVAEQTGETTAQHESWEELAAQWSSDGQMEPYLFHRSNPYALGAPIVRELSPTTMGVLELEAAVQQDPRDADAWLALGLKQQENEREEAAIRALFRATQLAPEARAAWLALAVSYTNEGKEDHAHSALERWIELGDENAYPLSESMGETREERSARIVERLIEIARKSPDDLDVDVQVALGVLFNASEDYHKAEDCFMAALEARPEDWVLHNRLGATLANSGRSHEAIKYYHRALALHPNFVRAQFNLGISYINLAQYRLAAQCILDAIRLQHADVTEGYGADAAGTYPKGVTSDALWTTLRMACLHLQRPDLVTLANHHDLSGFPLEL